MNEEFCPKHQTWFGRSPVVCPGCEVERAAKAKRNEDRRTKAIEKREQKRARPLPMDGTDSHEFGEK